MRLSQPGPTGLLCNALSARRKIPTKLPIAVSMPRPIEVYLPFLQEMCNYRVENARSVAWTSPNTPPCWSFAPRTRPSRKRAQNQRHVPQLSKQIILLPITGGLSLIKYFAGKARAGRLVAASQLHSAEKQFAPAQRWNPTVASCWQRSVWPWPATPWLAACPSSDFSTKGSCADADPVGLIFAKDRRPLIGCGCGS